MFWKGPSGLPGTPTEEAERYRPMPVEGREHVTCWVRDDVEAFVLESGVTNEGDYLFGSELAGRVRFRFVGQEM